MNESLKKQQVHYIINQAEEVFFDKGYAYANISEISKVAQRSRTTIYSYFENRENLYMAVIYKSLRVFMQELSKVNLKHKNGQERVLAYCTGYLNFCQNFPQRYQIILDYYTYVRNSTLMQPEAPIQGPYNYFEKVNHVAKVPVNMMYQEITLGQKDQSISANLPPEVLLLNIWAQLIGMSHLVKISSSDNFILVDKKIKDWQENALHMIKKMLLSER
ncbi:MAG TPA: hypothetical protein DCS93_28915 [Microscillaceae bacterium]|nr:hypothetical protein [Microscillaceae bacterium]